MSRTVTSAILNFPDGRYGRLRMHSDIVILYLEQLTQYTPRVVLYNGL